MAVTAVHFGFSDKSNRNKTNENFMLRLYNTLTGKKEEFKALNPPRAGMYNCGPTVYDYAHIGNLRAYVFADTLRRALEYNGYQVRQIINITDVGHLTSDADSGEDKMTRALQREDKPLTVEAMRELGGFYFERFVEDLKALNIEMPEVFPRASEHIAEDLEIIGRLVKKEIAYRTSDGLYFDTSRFENYGKLGKINTKKLREGARVEKNPEKKNPTDFNLWKFNDTLGWQSPWGKGFPGWHIECSAMSVRHLGQPFDIHTGGVDHIPIHHNNEIAQSEAASGKPLARYWLHSAFVNLKSGKMAKSGKNFLRLQNLAEKGVSPLAYRLWLLGAHYRTPVVFSFGAAEGAEKAYGKLAERFGGLGEAAGEIVEKYKKKFSEFVNDDLNTPRALALLWELIDDKKIAPFDKKTTAADFDRVLGLNIASSAAAAAEEAEEPIPEAIWRLARERQSARAVKDWKKADEIRRQITNGGYRIHDTAAGPALKRQKKRKTDTF